MKKNLRFLSLLLLTAFIWTSCRKVDWNPGSPTGSELFVSATPTATLTHTDLTNLAAKLGYGAFSPYLVYDVDYYKLVYKTNYKGRMIEASGTLGIPKNTLLPPSIISAQHGTMFSYADAPSNFPNTFTGFELFASAGYVTLIPDNIGLGVSLNVTQPYYVKGYSALPVVNMIEAAKYFLQQQNKAITNRLFLIGYSEGGYTTMAAQEEIETNAAHHLTVTAAAEGAGGYDLTTFLGAIADTANYSAPSFLGLILKSYNDTYDWHRPYTDFFQQPYAGEMAGLLNGSQNRQQIDAQLTTSTAALFNPVFYANLKNPAKETTLKTKIGENSFLTWVPKSPTWLFHGTADEAVPFETSVLTYNRFIAGGATNVKFTPIPGGTHETSVIGMMEIVLPWIASLDH